MSNHFQWNVQFPFPMLISLILFYCNKYSASFYSQIPQAKAFPENSFLEEVTILLTLSPPPHQMELRLLPERDIPCIVMSKWFPLPPANPRGLKAKLVACSPCRGQLPLISPQAFSILKNCCMLYVVQGLLYNCQDQKMPPQQNSLLNFCSLNATQSGATVPLGLTKRQCNSSSLVSSVNVFRKRLYCQHTLVQHTRGLTTKPLALQPLPFCLFTLLCATLIQLPMIFGFHH